MEAGQAKRVRVSGWRKGYHGMRKTGFLSRLHHRLPRAIRVYFGVAALILMSLSIGAMSLLAAPQYPNCNWRCSAKDVTIVDAYVDAPDTCSPGQALSATIYAAFDNGTNSNRYAVRVIGDIYVDGSFEKSIDECVVDTLGPGTRTVPLTNVSWRCGEIVEVRIVTVSWASSPETCGDTPRCAARAAKCWFTPRLDVGGLPLAVDFDSSSPECDGTAVSFTDRTQGGDTPYSYNWDFGDGGTSSSANPSHLYASPGNYVVTLTITERGGVTGSVSYPVVVDTNPVATASNGGPYCPGDTIALAASGGTFYRWTGPNGFAGNDQNPTLPNATGAAAGVYTVTVTNASGCADQASTLVEIDVAAPALTVPADVTIECGTSTDPVQTGQATATDDTDPSPDVTYADIEDLSGCGNKGTIIRTWTAIDDCGNSTSEPQTITIVDTTSPSLSVSSAPFECDGSGNTTDITTWLASAVGTDTCGVVTITHDYAGLSGTCSGSGSVDVTFRATDACGNETTRTATLTVVDTTPPGAGNDADSTDEDVAVTIDVLGNDSDACDPSPTLVSVGTPGVGVAELVAGQVRYTPPAGYSGTATFSYSIEDCSGNTASALVEVTILPVNDRPVANDQAATAEEDTPLPITVTATDPDGDVLTYTILTAPSDGTISGFDSATGDLLYTPDANYHGPDSFTFEACDPDGLCDTGTVTITVEPVDDPPEADPQTLTTPEDTPLPITVTGSDADGDPLTYGIVSGPSDGAISGFDANTGDLIYTPDPNFTGTDSFVFEACDPDPGHGCAQATVTITVTPVNDPPLAQDQSRTTPEDTETGFFALSVVDPDNTLAELSCDCVVPPTHGTVVRGPDHTVNYIPDPDFSGVDTFRYEVCDPSGLCDTATVTITVSNTNDNPSISASDQTTPENTPITFPVVHSDPDDDPLSCTASDPAHGSIAPASGIVSPPYPSTEMLTYTPDAGFSGVDQVVITCSDGQGGSDSVTVEITVVPVNDPPVANDQDVTAEEDTPLPITVTATDPDGDGLTYSILTTPTDGTISALNPSTGELTYTPDADYNGPDSFAFEACDPSGACDTGVVTITVEPVDDPPMADPQDLTTPEDTPLPIIVSGSDVDGDPITYGIVSGPSNGTISGFDSDTGDLIYTPGPNFTGTDSFVFEACDPDPGHGCAQATVAITVTPVNDPPVAQDQSRTTSEDAETGFFSLLVSDPDNTLAEIVCDCQVPPSHGTIIRGPDHTVNYIPDPDFSGQDTFRYKVCDPSGLCDTATVTVDVLPVPDPPLANDDAVAVAEDGSVDINVPANDSDPDGDLDVTSVVVLTQPAHGDVTVDPVTGTIRYKPDENFAGTDALTYEICDSRGACDTATVTVEVTPVNDPPVAVDDVASVAEDGVVEIDVADNDSDPDDDLDITSVSIISQPANGTVSVNPSTGEIRYEPDDDFNGTDTFTYRICDSLNVCDVATVTVDVVPVDDPPVARDDSTTTPEDVAVVIDVPGNDFDVDGNLDRTTVTIVSQPSNGTLQVSGVTGDVTYTPETDFNGNDTFSYRICDTDGLCDVADVTVNVGPEDDPPVARDGTGQVFEDGVTTIDVVDNDSDPDGDLDPTSVLVTSPPAHGDVTVNPVTGEIDYEPDVNYNGSDTFSYEVCDTSGACDLATVTITVTPVNDPPVAQDQSRTTSEDTETGFFSLLVSDPDNTLAEIVCDCQVPPSHGTVVRGPDHTVNYIPDPDFSGQDTFRYKVCDPSGLCDTATVTVDVLSVPDPPVAEDDAAEVAEDGRVDIDVPANDSDPDGNLDVTSVSIISQPPNGTVGVDPVTGIIRYEPDENFTGTDAFTYEICDSGGVCDTATVTVEVNPVNDPPVAVDDTASVAEDGSVEIDVPDNDSDPDGDLDLTTVVVLTQPTHGDVSIDPVTGEITYAPDSDFNGTDTFTYQICDSEGVCDTATVTVDVLPVPDPPVANDDAVGVAEDGSVDINVPANDSDADGNLDVASVAALTQPTHGEVTVDPVTGSITYEPDENFTGTDTFTYEICDSGGACDTATVTVEVNPVDDPPVAVDDTASVAEDGSVEIDVPDNDSDPDGDLDVTSVSIISQPTNGTVSVNPSTGEIRYEPDDDFNGTDRFNYEICDSLSVCDVATVTVDVVPVDDPPVAGNDSTSTPEDVAVVIDVPDNDFDVDGNLDPATVTIVSQPSNGTLSVSGITGAVTYTPATDFNGIDTFRYEICDTDGLCDAADVMVNVGPEDDPPVARDDTGQVFEDGVTTIDVVDNDSDPDGNLDPTSVLVTAPPAHGDVTVDAVTGEITYEPDENYNGADVFSYEICDTDGECDVATVTIEVVPIDDPPVANDDGASAAEDGSVEIDVADNDSDPDGDLDLTTVSILTDPANGIVSVDPVTGAITYEPDPNFNGPDSFTYQICDSLGVCDTAEVTVTVAPVDDLPVATPQDLTTPEDTPLAIGLIGSDADNDPLIYNILNGPTNGTISGFDPDTGDLIYTPDEDYSGPDSFTFEVCDPHPNECGTATVTIDVTPADDPPVAVDDSANVAEDGSVTIDVPDNDSDPDDDLDVTSVSIISQPGNGDVSIDPVTGEIAYEPDDDFNGTDVFTYQICDVVGACDTATVTVDVLPVPDPPVAEDDAVEVGEDGSVDIDVAANDSDPDHDLDVTSVVVLTQPTHGEVTVDPVTGSITYEPDENFTGTDTFTYEICDGLNVCDTATVTVEVTPVDDPPVALDDTASVAEDGVVEIDVADNDSDPDGDLEVTSVSIISQPPNGTVSVDPLTGEIRYEPDDDFNGTDTFTYQICDSLNVCDVATVTVDVVPVDDLPVARDDSTTTPEDVAVVIDVPGNDFDVDGNLDRTTVIIVSQPSNGTLQVSGVTGDVTYTPVTDFNGSDTFSYQICDTDGLCDVADVTVNVGPEDDPPVARDDTGQVFEDGVTTIDVVDNDSDPDGDLDPTSVLVTSPPAHGDVTVNPVTGEIDYKPDANYNGPDTLNYQVCDVSGGCDLATVTIDVVPIDDPPVAIDDGASVAEDSSIVIDVADNDSDPDGDLDRTTVSILTHPSNGEVTVDPVTGVITYEPDADYNGPDSFTYRICDGEGACDTAEVTVTVAPVDDLPVATPQDLTTPEDTPLAIGLIGSDADGDPLTYNILSGPTSGTISGFDPDTGDLLYTPNEDYNGPDSFVFEACDPHPNECGTATVTITVTPVPDPPVAVNDTANVAEDGVVEIDVPGNDSDPDGDLNFRTVRLIGLPSNGTAIVDPITGEIRYEPNQDFSGRDSFIYQICDSEGACDTARVAVNVIPINDPPIAADDAVSTQEDSAVPIPVTDNDYDPDGVIDPTSLVIVSGPSHGTASVDPVTGTITYEPSSNYAGDDSLVYQVCNTEGDCDVAVVDIVVSPQNDPPQAGCLETVVVDGTTMRIELQGTDPDGDDVIYRILDGPESGSILDFDEQAGTFTYVPVGFVGPDAVSYEVVDPFGATDRCVVQLFVVSTAGGGGVDACGQHVILSEIAWSGTAADPDHEWIELRNLEDEAVSLEGWTLRWRRKLPEFDRDAVWKTIALSGIIAAGQGSSSLQFRPDGIQPDAWWVSWESDPRNDFFLLERETDETILHLEADLVYEEEILLDRVADLADEGDVIELVDPTGCVVDTANVDAPDQDGWPAGTLLPAAAMERIDPFVPDLHENWHTNLGLVRMEMDARGDLIHGTPKHENSPVLSEAVAAQGIESVSRPMGEPILLRFDALSEWPADQGLWHVVVTRPATDLVLEAEWTITAEESGGLTVEVATSALPLNEEIHIWVRAPSGDLLVASVLLYPY